MKRIVAMGGIYLGIILLIGFAMALSLAFLLVFRRTLRSRAIGPVASARDRGARLDSLVLVCGPLVGLAIAFLTNSLSGDVHPDDARDLIVICLIFGVMAGMTLAWAFALASAFARKSSPSKEKGIDPEL